MAVSLAGVLAGGPPAMGVIPTPGDRPPTGVASADATVTPPGASTTAEEPVTSDEAGRMWLEAQIAWRDGQAVGRAYDGRLVDGVQLPVEGQNFFTWDAVHERLGNPDERRWATDELLLTILGVLDAYRAANPDAPRVGISDLSREHGGPFGVYYGGRGHVSHQNGLDADIAYPRRDRLERGVLSPAEVDVSLAQDLVDRFVAAGAEFVFVGESLGLTGPPDVVRTLPNHDDHLHLRIRPRR